jgi:hypothetical protein
VKTACLVFCIITEDTPTCNKTHLLTGGRRKILILVVDILEQFGMPVG